MRNVKMMLGAGLALTAGLASATPPEFDWLAGHWCGGSEGSRIDEVWLPEAGGALLGMSRTVRDSNTDSFEFMRLVPGGGDAGLHVQPNGVPATVFAIVEKGERWVRFQNSAHDFPNRIEYRLSDGRLLAEISGPGRDGEPMTIGFDYARCEMPVAP